MKANESLQSDIKRFYLVEGSRILLYVIILFAGITASLIQSAFINWAVLGPIYVCMTLGLGAHGLILVFDKKMPQFPSLFFFTFIFDSILISILIYVSGINQSLFLFLHLINILLSGLVFRTQGAVLIALVTSLFFTLASLLGPDMKALSFILLLALNNTAFFLVAGLSGYLSEQFENVREALVRTGLSLRAAQELNQLVVENIPSGIVTLGESGQVLQANPAATEILQTDLQGENIFHVLKEFSLQKVGDSENIELKYVPSTGVEQKLLGLRSSTFTSPEVGGSVRLLLLEDLTKMRQLEWELRQAEKMAAIGQLAAGIAHEIRNPLSGISGSVELLSQTTTNEDDQKLMNIILREIERLNGLITEFLEYSRPEKPPVDEVDLVPLMDEILQGVKFAKNIRSDISVSRQTPAKAFIRGHREKLKQALLNILINAYQAVENTLHPIIGIVLSEESDGVSLVIQDNGCGMSEVNRRRMFEPFHTTKKKGTGLGLAVTHKILEGHGARIFVESEEGMGTQFRLIFPRIKG